MLLPKSVSYQQASTYVVNILEATDSLISFFTRWSRVSPRLRHLYAAPSSFTAAIVRQHAPFVGGQSSKLGLLWSSHHLGGSPHSTTATRLRFPNAPIGVALLLWSGSLVSFWFDCLVALESRTCTTANRHYLTVHENIPPLGQWSYLIPPTPRGACALPP